MRRSNIYHLDVAQLVSHPPRNLDIVGESQLKTICKMWSIESLV